MFDASKDANWFELAKRAGTLPPCLDLNATLAERIAAAKAGKLNVGTIYARSSEEGVSVDRQVAECVAHAACHGIYVPAEFVFVDRADARADREGLRRLEAMLDDKTANVLVIAELARAFRTVFKGVDYLRELVKKGVRAIMIR